MTETLDPLLRTRGVLDATALSKSVFYVLRAHGEFPAPDGFHNAGTTPVWRTSTVRRWIEEQLERSRAEHQAKRLTRRRTGHADVPTTQAA